MAFKIITKAVALLVFSAGVTYRSCTAGEIYPKTFRHNDEDTDGARTSSALLCIASGSFTDGDEALFGGH